MVALSSVVILLAASLGANADAQPGAAELPAPAQHQQELSAAASSNYEQQQQQPSKGKKIQIVYIKVPLAKLKPSLSNADSGYTGDNSTRSNKGSQYDASK